MMDGKWLPREPVEQLLPHLPLWPGAMMRLADGPLQHNGDQVGGVEEPEVGNGSVCCFLCSASRGMCEWVTRLNTEVAR